MLKKGASCPERPAGTLSRNHLLLAALIGAAVLAYFPVLKSLVLSWAASNDTSHGFLVPPLALYFLWRKRGEFSDVAVKGAWFGFVVVLVSLASYFLATVGEIRTLASLSFVTCLCGAVIFLFGWSHFRIALFPLLFLLFMIPVPAQIIAALTIPLQLLVTKVAVALSSLAGIPLYCEGNVIFHSLGTFEVVQACSGLRSITALLMLGTVFGYVTLRSNMLRSMLVISAVPIAVAVNILRVFTMIAVLHIWGIHLTEGLPHTVLGIVLFCSALALFMLVRKGLSAWDR